MPVPHMGGDLAAQEELQQLVARCRPKAHLYTAREVEFLRDVARITNPTNAQVEWLRALADREPINFEKVNAAALMALDALLARWLPDGETRGHEYVALNPRRHDTRPGSFRINTTTGRWADFAASDARGGDPISLAAYLHHDGDQVAAGRALAGMLGV